MVRLRLTGPTRLDPALAGAGPASARLAVEGIHGVLGIEVDGVDLTGGRAEGPLLPALEALLVALAALQAGAPSAVADLRAGELLLVLRRAGGQARLTLADLGPPARLPVRDLEVDLGALTAAALEGAAELCRSLAGTPSAEALASRRLRQAARRPGAGAGPSPRSPGPSLPAETRNPPPAASVRCEVVLDEDAIEGRGDGRDLGLAGLLVPGRVLLVVGERSLAVDGLPYLTLRDLVDGLAEVARAEHRGDGEAEIRLGRPGRVGDASLRLELARGTVSLDGAPAVPATPLALAEAAREAVDRLAERLAPGPPALDELRAAAADALAQLGERSLGDLHLSHAPGPTPGEAPAPSQAPLVPGELRRIVLRVAWRGHVGEPVGAGLAQDGPALLVTGREAVLGRCGGRTWQAPGAEWAALAAGLLLVRRGDLLEAHEPRGGRVRWRLPLTAAWPTGAAGRPGGPLLLAEAGALSALDPRTGAPRWRLELPGGHGLALAALGSLVVAGSGSGLLHAVDPEGRLAWRVRAPGPALAPPLLVGSVLASLHAAGPGATLLLLEPATGRRRGEAPLDVMPAGAPLRWAGGVALAGRSGGEAVVTLVRPSTGRAWTVEAPLEGTPRLAVAGRALLAGDAEGGLTCLEPTGRLRWSLPAAAVGGAPPVASRGVVLAARDGLAVLDLATGRSIGSAPGLQPTRVLASGALGVAVLEVDGDVTGLTATGHLSVLPGRP